MASFDELQEIFVAQEFAMLGYAAPAGRVLQPPSLLPAGNDEALWAFFNTIPSNSQIYAPGGDKFFTAYSALIDSLIAGDGVLDPVAAAKRRLASWGHKPPAWNVGYAGLKKQLAVAPSVSVGFGNQAEPDSGFWGLWGDSPAVSGPSAKFAAANLSVDISIFKALSFTPTPGDWYVSSVLSLVHSTPSGLPWNPNSPITWQSTFGPDGNLQRFLTSLMVVSDMRVHFHSSAAFSAADQQLIQQNAAAGLWPYYLGAGDASTSVRFDKAGQMTASIISEANTPIAIAANVLTAAQYLGG
ncbi:hypothetical protein [Paraherbaspirillum soli]|uniref:Uncharacterized protein n=1 Tax=Paraherbaspirillum soli TaxID=631222 RepID=A0ABW0M2Z9_9BURK